jgi:DNA-binding NtrC family response regulator
MTEMIVVAHANSDERRELCQVLEESHYLTTPMGSLTGLLKQLRMSSCHAVILDLDSLPVDNRFIRELCKEGPELCVIAISSRTFHPNLEEAMRSHISACLSKPVNMDELFYWLKSICGGKPSSRASPQSSSD